MKFKTSFFTACLVLYKSTAHTPFPVRKYSLTNKKHLVLLCSYSYNFNAAPNRVNLLMNFLWLYNKSWGKG